MIKFRVKRSRLLWSAFILLITLNLVVGGLAYRYLGQIDENYSRLLDQGIPFLNSMQTATVQSSRAYAVLIDLTQAQTPAEVATLEAELPKIREVSDRIFGSPLNEKAVPAELKPVFNEIRALRDQNRARLEHFVDLIHAARMAEASLYLRTEIYPAQQTYLTKLDAFCDRYQESFATLNQKLTAENAQSRTFIVGLSAVPLAIALGMLALALLLVLLLMVLLRRTGSTA